MSFFIPELDRPTIARFFLQQYTCQVSSIQMALERLNETFKTDDSVSVDCPRASLIHRYQQGDMVRWEVSFKEDRIHPYLYSIGHFNRITEYSFSTYAQWCL